MAIPSTTIWEVRTTGSDSNGGGFDPVSGSGHTDYSQQNSPQLSLADVATTGTTTVTSATGGFTSAMIGNAINIVGDGVYFITAVGGTGSITVDRATGTATGQTGNVGGAFATLGYVGFVGAGYKVWMKSGTYTNSTSSTNVSGGQLDLAIAVEGYQTTRGDFGSPPKIVTASGQAQVIHQAYLYNLWFDSTVNSTTFGVSACTSYRVRHSGTATFMFFVGNARECWADGAGWGNGFYGGSSHFCVATNCGTGFAGQSSPLIGSAAIGCPVGFASGFFPINCLCYNCPTGFDSGCLCSGCVAYGCSTVGFNAPAELLNCFGGGNGADTTASTPWSSNTFTHLASDPYTNGSAGDFSLSAYGLTTLKGAGEPRTILAFSANNYKDAGPFQHQDSGGGGGGGSIFRSPIFAGGS